jgi:hypothetical protein
MPDLNNPRSNVLFSTMKLESEEEPRRCGLCGCNPSFFPYQKHSAAHPPHEEHGYCCAACAFTMLTHLAADEAREWAALADRSTELRSRL